MSEAIFRMNEHVLRCNLIQIFVDGIRFGLGCHLSCDVLFVNGEVVGFDLSSRGLGSFVIIVKLIFVFATWPSAWTCRAATGRLTRSNAYISAVPFAVLHVCVANLSLFLVLDAIGIELNAGEASDFVECFGCLHVCVSNDCAVRAWRK